MGVGLGRNGMLSIKLELGMHLSHNRPAINRTNSQVGVQPWRAVGMMS